MDTFDHVLNWKLKAGSHRFPGPNGGTCINEAALVAAGFKYRPINNAEQMPKCFSRPICRFAMTLNDQANDEERQHLLPYVARLACADTREVENARADYIHQRTHHYIYQHAQHYPRAVPFDVGLKVLEGTLAIGRQADPLGPDEVQTRMDAVKTKAAKAEPPPLASVPSEPFFSKVKSWLTMKETEPAA